MAGEDQGELLVAVQGVGAGDGELLAGDPASRVYAGRLDPPRSQSGTVLTTGSTGPRLLPPWPTSRILELAPASWKQTREHEDAQQRFVANVFRAITFAKQAPPV